MLPGMTPWHWAIMSFDYGSDVLEKRISEMDFPALAANITVDATGEPFTDQNAVFTLSDGTKVGVFGLDTPTTGTASAPKNTAGLSFDKGEELYAAAQTQIDELKGQGCSIIVCLGHLGEIQSNDGNNAENIVANTSGLSVVIDGHDHLVENQIVKDKEGNDVLIAETGYYLKNIGILTYKDGKFTESLAEVGTYKGSDPELEKMIADVTAEVESTMQEVVAVTEFDLYGEAAPGNRDRETTLGDFATDAIYWQVSQADTAPDAVVLNGGAIRASIKAGEAHSSWRHLKLQRSTLRSPWARSRRFPESRTRWTRQFRMRKGNSIPEQHTTRRRHRAPGSRSPRWAEKNSIRKPFIPSRPLNSLPRAETLIIALQRRAPKH